MAACEWYLKISREHFAKIYKGIDIDMSLFESQPDSTAALVAKYLPSKLWRLNNLHTIVPKRGPEERFNMNYAQHMAYAYSIRHPRLIILKSRQQGISTLWLISFVDDSLFIPNLTTGLMAQGLDEAATLLQRVKLDWEKFPSLVKNVLGIKMSKDNSKEVQWSNGSMLFIRTSFRSTTLQRLHISELAKIAMKTPKRAEETKTGTLQALAPGNVGVIESTAEGRTMFTDEWNKAVGNEQRIKQGIVQWYTHKQFQPLFLPWFEDPDCNLELEKNLIPSKTFQDYFDKLCITLEITLEPSQVNFWLDQYEELEDKIYQEYPATPEEAFMAVHNGSYYGTLYNKLVVARGRIREHLYDSNLSVDVVLDLGMDDTFVLFFYQNWRGEERLIDEYTNSGEGLEHYANVMLNSGYNIANVVCPHDINVRELNYNKTRKARLYELGIRNIRVLRRTPELDGIEQVRKDLKNLYIDAKCVYAQSCYVGFSKKWDDVHGIWKDKPAESKFNHGADVFRYRAMFKTAYVEDFDSTAPTGYDVGTSRNLDDFDL